VLLFFWAHWCGDCKREVPDLARLVSEYQSKGLVLIGPSQHYGYTAGGEDASRERETHYIDEVRTQYYAALGSMSVPLSEANFIRYGASTTPTIVLVDRQGIVRLYHPGAMPYAQLAAKVAHVVGLEARAGSKELVQTRETPEALLAEEPGARLGAMLRRPTSFARAS